MMVQRDGKKWHGTIEIKKKVSVLDTLLEIGGSLHSELQSRVHNSKGNAV